MSYGNNITTSIFGRRFGLQALSSAVSGSARAGETPDMLLGAEALKQGVNTGSTSRNLPAYGISRVVGTSADSSSVFTLDPPIPGVEVNLYFPSTGNTACYVKTANSEIIHSTLGSSQTVIKSTIGGLCKLVGITTAIWGALGITSGTSSQAGGFTLSTTT